MRQLDSSKLASVSDIVTEESSIKYQSSLKSVFRSVKGDFKELHWINNNHSTELMIRFLIAIISDGF